MNLRREGTMGIDRFCAAGDCLRAATHGALCRMHARRRDRGKPMAAPAREAYATPWARLHEAALALADAGSEDAYRNASRRLRDAAIAYSLSRAER